jgi:hypothetical protein
VSEENLGAKPSQGTKKDKRLKPNKYVAEDGTESPTDWQGVLVVEDVTTGDGREFAGGALSWSDLPLTLRWNKEDSHGGIPSTVAVGVGSIDQVWRDGNKIMGSGRFDTEDEDGARAFRKVRDGFLKGVSVDVDDIADADVEYIWPEKPEGEEADEDGDDLIMLLFGRPEKTVFHAGRIRAATLCDIPAFVEAYIELTDAPDGPSEVEPGLVAGAVSVHTTSTSDTAWDGSAHDRILPMIMSMGVAQSAYAYVDENCSIDGGISKAGCRFIHHEVSPDGLVGPANLTACAAGIGVLFGSRGGTRELSEATRKLVYQHLASHLRDAGREPEPYRDETIAAALVAGAGADDWRPPREWFEDPKLNQLVPIMVRDDGRIYGHAAQWGECHLGFGSECVTAPREDGHPYFMTGEVICADGSHVAVGQVFTRGAHAPLGMGPSSAINHYEHTGYVVADITVGNDRHGIWVAGAVRSDALATRVNELRASGQVSPDWRRIGGQLRMVGMLVVNISGYQVPRPRARMFAGEVQALVAAGIVQVGSVKHRGEDNTSAALQLFLDQLTERVHGTGKE